MTLTNPRALAVESHQGSARIEFRPETQDHLLTVETRDTAPKTMVLDGDELDNVRWVLNVFAKGAAA